VETDGGLPAKKINEEKDILILKNVCTKRKCRIILGFHYEWFVSHAGSIRSYR